MPDLDESCGQLCSGHALSIGSQSGSIPENQPARKDSETTRENPHGYKYRITRVNKAGREGAALSHLWTNPESTSRSRGILSPVERAELKGSSEPLSGEEQAFPQKTSQLR